MLHNALISLRPMFALMFLALLFYLRVLYVRRRRRKNGLPEVPFRIFVKRKKN
jgi:cbb3-type cytochrome oxidase subunit 3